MPYIRFGLISAACRKGIFQNIISMILVATGTFIAFVITFFIMPFIIRIAKINKLFDIPDERKHILIQFLHLAAGHYYRVSYKSVTRFRLHLGNSEFQYYLACFSSFLY